MIKVVFERRCENLVSFNIKGHAGYDEYGRDIVCSAVSAISATIINGITEVLKIDAPYEVHEDGFMELSLNDLNDEKLFKCQVLMETMLVSLQSMIVNYGDFINLKVREV